MANLIEQFRKHASVEEDKLTIDRMTGAEVNALTDEEGQTSLSTAGTSARR